MSHRLQTHFVGATMAGSMDRVAAVPHTAMSTTGPWPEPRHQGPSPGCPKGSRRGCPALPVSLGADSVCAFLLQVSCCPFILWVPASWVCQIQGCPDAPLHSSCELCDELCSSTAYIPGDCLPRFLASKGIINPLEATTNHLFLAIT